MPTGRSGGWSCCCLSLQRKARCGGEARVRGPVVRFSSQPVAACQESAAATPRTGWKRGGQ